MEQALQHPERVAVARLHALLELLPTALERYLAPANLTAFEYLLLEALSEAEDYRLRMSALAAKTNATLPRLSRVVSTLGKRGLVKRAPCPQDGRATNAVLTPEGLEKQREAQSLYAHGVRTLILAGLEGIPGDGVQQLSDIAHAVLSTLDEKGVGNAAGADCAADPQQPACSADPAGLPSS